MSLSAGRPNTPYFSAENLCERERPDTISCAEGGGGYACIDIQSNRNIGLMDQQVDSIQLLKSPKFIATRCCVHK